MPLLAADPTAAATVAPFDDDAWEDLLNFVEEKRVIPIVGPELVTVPTDAHLTGSASSPQAGSRPRVLPAAGFGHFSLGCQQPHWPEQARGLQRGIGFVRVA